MPLGEIVGGLVGAALRLIAHFFIEIVLEIAIRGPGYLICRLFRRDIDPDGGWVAITGVVFWVALITAGLYLFR